MKRSDRFVKRRDQHGAAPDRPRVGARKVGFQRPPQVSHMTWAAERQPNDLPFSICRGLQLRGSTGPQQLAWWVTVRFVPQDLSIEGIPVRELDRDWVAASVLKAAALPAEASAAGESVEEHDGAFEISRDLDRDGRLDRALVGVYKTHSGEVGRFLLVLSTTKGGKWSKRALFKQSGEAGFSVLWQQRERLVWAFCMECDSSCEVTPRRGAWRLKCQSCCPDMD